MGQKKNYQEIVDSMLAEAKLLKKQVKEVEQENKVLEANLWKCHEEPDLELAEMVRRTKEQKQLIERQKVDLREQD